VSSEISPFSMLPWELHVEIFRYCNSPKDLAHLSQVCSFWRHVSDLSFIPSLRTIQATARFFSIPENVLNYSISKNTIAFLENNRVTYKPLEKGEQRTISPKEENLCSTIHRVALFGQDLLCVVYDNAVEIYNTENGAKIRKQSLETIISPLNELISSEASSAGFALAQSRCPQIFRFQNANIYIIEKPIAGMIVSVRLAKDQMKILVSDPWSEAPDTSTKKKKKKWWHISNSNKKKAPAQQKQATIKAPYVIFSYSRSERVFAQGIPFKEKPKSYAIDRDLMAVQFDQHIDIFLKNEKLYEIATGIVKHFVLKNNLLVFIRNDDTMVTWCIRNNITLSEIDLKNYVDMDFVGDAAAVVMKNQENGPFIQFFKVTKSHGQALFQLTLEDLSKNNPEKSKTNVIQKVKFDEWDRLMITTAEGLYFFPWKSVVPAGISHSF
jgi:hypothetical protein